MSRVLLLVSQLSSYVKLWESKPVKYNIIIKRLLVLKLLHFANRLLFSFITHYFIVKMIIGHHTEFMLFYIIKLLLLILVILKMP